MLIKKWTNLVDGDGLTHCDVIKRKPFLSNLIKVFFSKDHVSFLWHDNRQLKGCYQFIMIVIDTCSQFHDLAKRV